MPVVLQLKVNCKKYVFVNLFSEITPHVGLVLKECSTYGLNIQLFNLFCVQRANYFCLLF